MDDDDDLSMWVNRHQNGDPEALDKLIEASSRRLEKLARKMLRGFPKVKRWEDTMDVLQNALVRLHRALKEVKPESSRHFMGLAAEQIRRELLDLARHYGGPRGHGRNHQSGVYVGDAAHDGLQPVAPTETDELDRWANFHERVETLPVEEREVFMLVFYHKWKHAQIAELFQIDERTVRRRWRRAAEMLHEFLGGELPGQ